MYIILYNIKTSIQTGIKTRCFLLVQKPEYFKYLQVLLSTRYIIQPLSLRLSKSPGMAASSCRHFTYHHIKIIKSHIVLSRRNLSSQASSGGHCNLSLHTLGRKRRWIRVFSMWHDGAHVWRNELNGAALAFAWWNIAARSEFPWWNTSGPRLLTLSGPAEAFHFQLFV